MKQLLHQFRQSGVLQLSLKILITLLVFWLVLRGIDFSHMEAVLQGQNRALIAVSAVCIALQMIIGAYRWRLVVNTLGAVGGHSMSHRASQRIYYISMFFTCCLPGAVGGDVVRVWLGKSQHLPFSVVVNSVIIDRLVALLALILMVVVTMPILGISAGINMLAIWAVLAVCTLAGLGAVRYGERFLGPYRHRRPVNWLLYLIGSVRMIITNPSACMRALFLAIAGQLVYALSAWILARSLHIDMTLMQSITLMPPVMLATTLPISIGGWGVREASSIGMLGLVGVPQASALVLSLQLGLLSVLVSLPACILWLRGRKSLAQPAPHASILDTGV